MDKDELRALRAQLGLTQDELAKSLGLSHRDTVRAWEAGKTRINGPAALAIRLVARLKEAADDTAEAVLDGLWRGA